MKFKLTVLIVFLALFCTPSHAQTETNLPSCGLHGNQNPFIPGTTPAGGSSNWATFVAPTIGASYVDGLTGCTIWRITNDAVSSNQYPSLTSISADDKFIMVNHTDVGSADVRTAPGYYPTFTPGTVVVTAGNMPGNINGDSPWDLSTDSLYYPNGTILEKATITGLPGCISTHTCTMTSSAIHTFSGCNSINIMDEADISLSNSIAVICYVNSGTTVMTIETYNLTTAAVISWYTTSSACKSTPSNQPNCLHKLQLTNLGEPLVTYNNNGTGTEEGTKWYHGSPTITATLIQNATNHFDSGQDKSGNEVFIQDRLDTTIGTDPCPSGQWSGSAGNGGTPISFLTTPTTGTCIFNKVWATPHVSYRGTVSQPWVVESEFEDGSGRTASPEWFSTSGNYHAPTSTSTNPPTATSAAWYIYEDEIVMYPVDNANGLTDLYRLAQARSRSQENFWAQVNASVTRDGNYVAFTSNMAFPTGSCGNPSSSGCTDVYVISGSSGAPLLGAPAVTTPPAPHAPVIFSSLPPATAGTAYSGTLSVSDDTPPLVWTWTNPTIPEIAQATSGVISGTPQTAGTFPVTGYVNDSFDCTGQTDCSNVSAVYSTTLTVNPPVVIVPPPPVQYVGSVISGAGKAVTSLSFTQPYASQTVKVIDSAPIDIPVTVTTSASWLVVNPGSGSTGFNDVVSVNTSGLAAGTYSGNIILTSSGWSNSPMIIPVKLTVSAVGTLPVITTQPISQMIATGQTAVLSVIATGTGVTYQWSKNGTAISGATSSSYVAASAGSYTVKVTDSAGSVTSSAATLTVQTLTPGMTTTCAWLGDNATYQCNSLTSNMPKGTAIKVQSTADGITNSNSGVHP